MYTVTWTIAGIVSSSEYIKLGDARAKVKELSAKGITATITNASGKVMKDSKKQQTTDSNYARFHIATGLMVEIVEERQNNNILVHLLNNGEYVKYFEVIARSSTELRAI